MTRPPRDASGPRGKGRDAGRPDAAVRSAGHLRPESHGETTSSRQRRKFDGPRADSNLVTLWGYHSVREALRAERREVVRLVATAAAAERLAPEIAARGLTPVIVTTDEIATRVPRDAVHQGMMLEARPLAPIGIDELPGRGLVVVLDQVTDPHNVGAILRTAAAFGVVGIVTTERHTPEMTGILAKAASGALEHVPIVAVVNLARALEHLGDRGFVRIGLDSEGAVTLQDVPPDAATALVLGAEGKGLRRLTRENCDVVARLDMPGAIKSLNVSNACAAALTVLHLRRSAER